MHKTPKPSFNQATMPPSPSDLRLICTRQPGNELIAAECENLTGGRPDADGVAVCQSLAGLERSAYLNTGLHCLAEAQTLPELAQQIALLHLAADRFRVDFLRLSPAFAISKQAAILAAANAIPAWPDLKNPLRRFMIVAGSHSLWFGEVLVENPHGYTKHATKPYRTSSSLSTRLARALVNLVAPPAQSILDPFCGTGSVLLEANACGLQAWGMDWNPKMVGMARRNLRHFGYPDSVDHGDMLTCEQRAGALVSDLPYGRMLEPNATDLLAIFRHAQELAPLAVYLAEADLSAWLAQAGYQNIEVWRVRKNFSLSRYVHRVHSPK